MTVIKFIQYKNHGTAIFIISFCFLISIQGCGGNETAIVSKDTGSATFSIQWPESAYMKDNGIPPEASSITNIDCAALGVTTVWASVSGVDDSWSCPEHSGKLNNIPIGSGYIIYIVAFDIYWNQLFKGEKSGINIIADQTTNIGTVVLESVTLGSPRASITSPVGGYVFRNGLMVPVDQTIDAGSFLNFQGEASGGKAPYSYNWDFNGGAPNFSVQNPGNVTFSTPGSYPVIFEVTDADGATDSSSPLNIIVQAIQGSSTPPLTAVIISPVGNQTIAAGDSLCFVGSVIGGTAPYTYQWSSDGDIVNSLDQNPEDVTFGTLGSLQVTFQVTDDSGGMSSASVTVTVQ